MVSLGNQLNTPFVIVSATARLRITDGSVSQAAILSEFVPAFSDRFDSESTSILPTPENRPDEIPLAILRSTDDGDNETWSAQLGKQSAGITWSPAEEVPAEEFNTSFVDFALEFLKRYGDRFEMEPIGVGVARTIACSAENPAQRLSRAYCCEQIVEEPLSGIDAFELHARHTIETDISEDTNSWTKLKTGYKSENANDPETAIIVEQDLNAGLSEELSNGLTYDEVSTFFRSLPDHFEERIAAFFGTEERQQNE